MARIKGENGFLSGMVGNVSFYKRKDLEGVIVRTKGGPSKNMLKKSDQGGWLLVQRYELFRCSRFHFHHLHFH